MNKWIKGIVCALVFCLCMVLVIKGQRNIGPAGLGVMLLGVAGLLGLMYTYNKKYQ